MNDWSTAARTGTVVVVVSTPPVSDLVHRIHFCSKDLFEKELPFSRHRLDDSWIVSQCPSDEGSAEAFFPHMCLGEYAPTRGECHSTFVILC